MNEEQLFQKIFVENAFGSHHEMQSRNFIEQNPTYEHWLHIKEKMDFYVVNIDPHLLAPQQTSAINDYDKSPYGILGMPTVGTQLFMCLSEPCTSYKYAGLYKRITDFFSTAISVSKGPVYSPPGITLFDSHPDVHPGNKLTTAHQILNRELQAIVWYPKDTKFHKFLPSCNYYKKLDTLNDIQEFYIGNTRGFIHKNMDTEKFDVRRIHMWSDFSAWETSDSTGYAAPPKLDLRKFAKHTLKYPGVPVEFADMEHKLNYAKVIIDPKIVAQVFKEWKG